MIPVIAFFIHGEDIEIRVSEGYDNLTIDEQLKVLSSVVNAAHAMLEDSKRDDGCTAFHRVFHSKESFNRSH